MEYPGKQGTARIPRGSQTNEGLGHSGLFLPSMMGAGGSAESHRKSLSSWGAESP